MNNSNSPAGHSAEDQGRKLAKEVSGNASTRSAVGDAEKRKVDGAANAKGRDLAQAVAGDTTGSQPDGSNGSSQSATGTQRKASLGDNDSARRERIARAAYHKAEQRGFGPDGHVEDWLKAERELDEQDGSGGIG